MASKGFNSVLFDFHSIIDIELSVINFIREKYRDSDLILLDKNRILYDSMDSLRFERFYGKEDLFKSLIIDKKRKDEYEKILNKIVKENEKDILHYAKINKPLYVLLNAYKKTGDGLINVGIQCETKAEQEYMQGLFPNTPIEFGNKEDVDTDKYGMFIIGRWKDALKYNIEMPKSILITDYRDNFTEKDNTLLHAELIISLGDINDIRVISAYKTDNEK